MTPLDGSGHSSSKKKPSKAICPYGEEWFLMAVFRRVFTPMGYQQLQAATLDFVGSRRLPVLHNCVVPWRSLVPSPLLLDQLKPKVVGKGPTAPTKTASLRFCDFTKQRASPKRGQYCHCIFEMQIGGSPSPQPKLLPACCPVRHSIWLTSCVSRRSALSLVTTPCACTAGSSTPP